MRLLETLKPQAMTISLIIWGQMESHQAQVILIFLSNNHLDPLFLSGHAARTRIRPRPQLIISCNENTDNLRFFNQLMNQVFLIISGPSCGGQRQAAVSSSKLRRAGGGHATCGRWRASGGASQRATGNSWADCSQTAGNTRIICFKKADQFLLAYF